ncbi:carboxypeptidase-like regulatory domain-containing protein [Hymenobacter armeniacus]|uniref:Carboxypeptidase-like regulatory domain-containing protein n=1 Tax=Hymenobacter armeniacus TaxID=2771358 RepID=A0ABR8JU62_9BACT|nr:carboxypeptidase-like regulatory domain-containing protein [Hymenobacter armeniacus]MBD2722862.1 carboxypeptidase-like regulatory domain-containing protein [Hymenobacter armeniacus]
MRASFFFLLFALWLPAATAAAQPISGTITNAATRAGLPYVNIGVVGKNLGTVSTEQGTYQLAFLEALANDTVRVSSVGYQTQLLTLRALRAHPNVALAPESVSLQEVQVQGKSLFRRNVTLGNTGNSEASTLNLRTKDLGSEMGTVISLKHKPTRLLTANFNLAYNKIGPLALRVNLYRLDAKGRPTETKLPNRDLIVHSDLTKGTISVDLTADRLVVDEDFFLAVEWITNNPTAEAPTAPTGPTTLTTKVHRTEAEALAAQEGLAFSIGVGYANNDLYLRSTSQGTWERASIGALLLGMQPRISFFVTAQD